MKESIVLVFALMTSFYTVCLFTTDIMMMISIIKINKGKLNMHRTMAIGLISSILWGFFYYLTH
jgi:hypothetical protein